MTKLTDDLKEAIYGEFEEAGWLDNFDAEERLAFQEVLSIDYIIENEPDKYEIAKEE